MASKGRLKSNKICSKIKFFFMENRMLIKRTSMFTGIERTLNIDVTQEQLDNYNKGMLLPIAFPNLSPSDREFIHTGIYGSEWEEGIGSDE